VHFRPPLFVHIVKEASFLIPTMVLPSVALSPSNNLWSWLASTDLCGRHAGRREELTADFVSTVEALVLKAKGGCFIKCFFKIFFEGKSFLNRERSKSERREGREQGMRERFGTITQS
jgi:hypothetical protein